MNPPYTTMPNFIKCRGVAQADKKILQFFMPRIMITAVNLQKNPRNRYGKR